MTAFQPLVKSRLFQKTTLRLPVRRPSPNLNDHNPKAEFISGILSDLSSSASRQISRDVVERFAQIYEFRCTDPIQVFGLQLGDVLTIIQSENPRVAIGQTTKLIRWETSSINIALNKLGMKLILGVGEVSYYQEL